MPASSKLIIFVPPSTSLNFSQLFNCSALGANFIPKQEYFMPFSDHPSPHWSWCLDWTEIEKNRFFGDLDMVSGTDAEQPRVLSFQFYMRSFMSILVNMYLFVPLSLSSLGFAISESHLLYCYLILVPVLHTASIFKSCSCSFCS